MDKDRMQRLVAATEGRVYRSWLAMIAALRARNSASEIEDRIQDGRGDPLDGVDSAASQLAIGFSTAYIAAGQTTAKWLGGRIGKSLVAKRDPAFDPASPPSAQWMQINRLELIREIDKETRDLVRDVLLEGARTGTNPKETARELRDSIGLTSYQQSVVANYRRQLEQGQYAAALQRQLSSGQSDRAIRGVMGKERELTAAQIETAVERYRDNWIDLRAKTIARTEGLRVAHQGSEELYRQAVERGDVEPEQIQRTWNHHARPGQRDFHRSMHGQIVGFDEPFVSGIGGILRYPGDPEAGAKETIQCTCVVTTRIVPLAGSVLEPQGDVEFTADDERAAAVAAEQAARAEIPEVQTEQPLPLTRGDPDLEWRERLQRAQEMADARRAARDQARADLMRAEQEAAAAEAEQQRVVQEVAPPQLESGFRIGVTSDIAGETEVDETDWLADQRAQMTRDERQAAETAEQVATSPLMVDPYRSPASAPLPVPSDKFAPPGFTAVDFDGTTYYQHQLTGRAYTASDMAERDRPVYAIELGALNNHLPGFETLEIKTPSMISGEVRYRSKVSGSTYTAEMVASGEAAAQERFLAADSAASAVKPGILGRVFRRLWSKDGGR